MRGQPPTPGTPGRRGVYITLERQIEHGATPGCPGCNTVYGDNPKPHSPECRARFEKLLGKAVNPQPSTPAAPPAEGMDLEAAPSAGDSAEVAADRTRETAAGSSTKGTWEQLPEGAQSSSSGLRRPAADETAGPTESKRRKEAEAKGQKREAETPQQEAVAEDVTLQELIGGMPTLHDVGRVAGYPETGKLQAAWDERTGESLPLEKVRKARGRELDKMEEHQVKRDITWEEAREKGLKIVRSRWVDGWKALPDDPKGVRSRCVTQEVNTHQRDDVFSGTPPLKAHRMVVSAAATSKKGRTARRRLIARYDVSVAFFHAPATGKIAVVPPKDLDQGSLWYLLKAMNGTRKPSKQWAKRILAVMSKAGFLEVASVPGLFYHPEWDVTLSCHGDDFLAEGEAQDLDKLDEVMLANFETKVLPPA